jgi:glycine/D-amino acid oxidase-like deaminating enzyme
MDPDFEGDLGVDVLVIGAGIQGLYIARELARSYAVCVVSDPAIGAATLDSSGYFSAGYDGNDANRIQPARRAAGWWRLWAESNEVPFNAAPPWYVVPAAEVSSRTRLWTDAMLTAPQANAVPESFADGSLAGATAFAAEEDVVMDPAVVLGQLRRGLESRCLEGEIVRFGLASDDVIDHVQVQVGDDIVPIVPRYVVVAAGVGNADLLTKLGSRFSDQAKRKASKALADECQAVRAQYVVCVRGADLPDLSGRFGELMVTSQRLTGSGDRVWLVEPPIDDALTTAGADNLRFERPTDPIVVARTVEQLLAMSPTIEHRVNDLQWSVYVARHTQHPVLIGTDTGAVAHPVPAKLEKFGLEAFLAVWPSHLAYAQFVGDSVAERVAEALGPAQDFGPGPAPADFGVSRPAPRARWDRDDFGWLDWPAFTAAYGLDPA